MLTDLEHSGQENQASAVLGQVSEVSETGIGLVQYWSSRLLESEGA